LLPEGGPHVMISPNMVVAVLVTLCPLPMLEWMVSLGGRSLVLAIGM
jgi:hypothetical protein